MSITLKELFKITNLMIKAYQVTNLKYRLDNNCQ